MNIDCLLEKYGVTRDTATRYVDAITRLKQTRAADELDVSRDTIHRYKNAFAEMTAQERARLIASLTQDKLLETATDG